MPKIYKQNCFQCGKYYEGDGERYCSRKCYKLAVSKKPAHNFKNLTGQRFGKLTVVKRIGRKRSFAYWLCNCDCGKTTKVTSGKLINKTRSCGCLIDEKRRKKGEWRPSKDTKLKMSQAQKKNPIKYWLGKNRPSHSIETREKMSQTRIANREKNPNWKGGITAELTKLRHSLAYKLWREAVFIRDNYTCQFCRKRGGRLQADHIKPFAYFPDLRFALSNGRTLCIDCHKTTDTYLSKANKHKAYG